MVNILDRQNEGTGKIEAFDLCRICVRIFHTSIPDAFSIFRGSLFQELHYLQSWHNCMQVALF